MKKLIFAICTTSFLLLGHTLYAQSNTQSQIEVKTFTRWDNYPQYAYNYNGRASTDNIKMSGTNIGININYKFSMGKNVYLKTGLGYFKYSFDKLNDYSPIGSSTTRPIAPPIPNPSLLLFYTNKYYYNTGYINFGIEKQIGLSNGIRLIMGLNAANYFTFSQYYYLQGNQDYKESSFKYFGFSTSFTASLIKQYGKVQIGPSLILPVFDLWKKDDIFLEMNAPQNKTKWSNGIGLSIICNISLNKKAKKS